MNLVFASGFLVPQHILGVAEYFRDLKDHIKTAGKHKALFATVPPTGSCEDRAKLLADAMFRKYPEGDIHIVAHSTGGLDSRVLIARNHHGLSERIKSLATISTPHFGTPIADLLTGRRPGDEREFLADIAHVFGLQELGGSLTGIANLLRLPGFLADITGVIRFLGLDRGALEDLTTQGAGAIPDPAKLPFPIRYRSYAAVGRPPSDFVIIQKRTCLIFVPMHKYIQKVRNEENDGLVPLSSTNTYGEFQGKWQCDHADAVGYDLDAGFFNGFEFDHLAKYDAIINQLEE
jgi:hypothetical protein